ncbi:YpoC family protein [Neobacillus niacini]|uniref:YpoC family protein n=1 Tax=Neobacillus niacini TaxID=86668 RepID=UPI002FFFDF96
MDNRLIIPFLKELEVVDSSIDVNEAITRLRAEWNQVKAELENLFRNRDQKTTLHGMNKGIGLYIQFLFLSNDRQVHDLESFDTLVIKPVNLEERLGFIINRPNLFHSYRQLSELILEQEKLYAKKNIVKKRLSQ